MGELRDIVAVVVATDSPAGRLADAINILSAHLPTAEQPTTCPLCPRWTWPCSQFDDAARRIQNSGVAIGPFIPLDLHPRLWPPAPPQPEWFDKE